MGIRVVMELEGDNDDLHVKTFERICANLDIGRECVKTTVRSCVITTGKVTIEEELDGSPYRRPQRVVR